MARYTLCTRARRRLDARPNSVRVTPGSRLDMDLRGCRMLLAVCPPAGVVPRPVLFACQQRNRKAARSAYPCGFQVGARGFEPPTSRTRTVRASRSALRPDASLTGGRHYTPDAPGCKVQQRRLPVPVGTGGEWVRRWASPTGHACPTASGDVPSSKGHGCPHSVGHTCLRPRKVACPGRLCYTGPHDTSRRFLMYRHRPKHPREQE